MTSTSTAAKPLVTIVIPFYNDRYIDQAVASALSQTYAPIEVIVVDDGSTLHQEKLQPYMGRIHYLGKSNGGTASALNYGIRLASGKYVAWLSSDDVFYAHKIARQVEYMERHQALISCTDFNIIGPNSEQLMHSVAVKFGSAKEFIRAMLSFCPVNGCTVMMHRSLPNRVGWFNETLASTQDYEFWLRVLLARVDFHYINEQLTAYRWHEGMGTQRHKAAASREFARVRDYYAPRISALLQTL
ncbi:glycosyltransferase [Cohnella lubricantis]|uniref:Glycosyltransferase n=1 Tax=Cohnella lubricantis TaxID=2163172 RepID=A0A841TKS1_9BACL|nr:glycosyltransferase [Cohnella lubricantis]MBB6679790.1 glycosyltransferase [Cohnella lubricantis]MBP2120343.1 glycosyltransferase involved in cell wall biosynthesis [Cohnella lubricantis]